MFLSANRKPSATALNEVTATIQGETNINYHESFLHDLKTPRFKFMATIYNLLFDAAGHYEPGFWDFPLKWGMFFEQHKLLAGFFDWFGLRKRAVHMVGFLYKEGDPDPVEITAPEYDFALENWNLEHNTTIEDSYEEDDKALRGTKDKNTNYYMLLLVALVVIIAGVVLVTYLSGQHTPIEGILNATATPHPTTIHLGGP